MRVAINAQLVPGGGGGGVEQFATGLIYGLGRLLDGPEEYLIVTPWAHPRWPAPFLGPNQRIVAAPRGSRSQLAKRLARQVPAPILNVGRRCWQAVRSRIRRHGEGPPPRVPESEGFFEALGANVVHFPYQEFTRCSVPTVYNPHDLQHLHYPQFFTEGQIKWREAVYATACREAQAVVADSAFVRDDIVRHHLADRARTYVILPGPATEFCRPLNEAMLDKVRRKFRLPQDFALYPGQTWPHKNHVRLLSAIRLSQDQFNVWTPVVCTGTKTRFWPEIQKQIRELRLENSVHFVGFVGSVEMRALYRLAQFMIFPSLFEGAGLPILEAFAEGVPVASSIAGSLAEYGGDAVLSLDPTSVESIAQALGRMTLDAGLRAALRERGAARARLFSWERAARMYRAVYRTVAGLRPAEEDEGLLREACS